MASSAGSGLSVLLACFRGAKRAGKVRRKLDQRIKGSANKILDDAVLWVDAKHRVRIADPRQVVRGTLTTALTWGIFGLITSGVHGVGIAVILGAICGGLFAYFVAGSPFPKNQLKRIGGHLPGNSSSIMAFVQDSDGQRLLSTAASCQPAEVSVAVIGADLSADVLATDTRPDQTPSAAPDSPAPGGAASLLNMLLMRYPGSDTAGQKLAQNRSAHPKDSGPVQVELLIEAPEHGRLKVTDPARGAGPAAAAKNNLVSWGLFGLVYGAIVGVSDNHGILSHIKSGLVTGVLWGVLGAGVGALYGLWVMRAVSARRLKGIRPLLPPGTSTLLAWSEGDLRPEMLGDWSAPGWQRLILRFSAVSDGMRLEALPRLGS